MTTPTSPLLPLASDGCGCCAPSTPSATVSAPAVAAATDATPEGPTTYQVTGMTCGHCAGNVTEAVSALPQVDLIAGGVSIVTVTGSVPLETVHRAIEETGYTVLS
ncbi:heavy-metal-associated domain-containing protein [Corynebacterium glutamicum]|uniref:heavy-metal-associated domain-containing protein n=1 Tax=Corynebacterium glutamicum TaxID=1718 RepID=UPI0009455FA0|nr:metal transporter [Corynebacterium glutamicum]